MTVKHLLASMDSREITEWIAYFNLLNKPGKKPENKSLDQQFKDALKSKRKTV
jgi:hypothetical protein